jgi:hypothetical protein
MACTAYDLLPFEKTREKKPLVPIIADAGDRARVILVSFEREPALGQHFQAHGRTWEIVRAKDHLRGWVARPAS